MISTLSSPKLFPQFLPQTYQNTKSNRVQFCCCAGTSISTNTSNSDNQIHEIERLCDESNTEAAIRLTEQLVKNGSSIQVQTLVLLLQSCAGCRSVSSLRRAQYIIMKSQPKVSNLVLIYLASMYYKLGSKTDARQVLVKMFHRPKAPKHGNNNNKKKETYEKVRELHQQIRKIGYVPDTRYVVHDIDQEAKEQSLMYHSERLAIAFGIVSTPPGTTLRIMKNLRICGDCHNAVKLMSRVVGREIVMRDNKRFHRFSDGVCSCGDFW